MLFFKKKKHEQEESKKEIEQPVIIKVKKKRISISIKFHNNDPIGYSQDHEIDSNLTYITVFYDFYNWFFNRKESDVYVFRHIKGANIFYREDIKSISFLQEEVEV